MTSDDVIFSGVDAIVPVDDVIVHKRQARIIVLAAILKLWADVGCKQMLNMLELAQRRAN